ncbi:hypothetical protein SRABI70_04848 [Pseudomonas sp. Bi70]|nr:hypothetical protein SRABI70_04848 [Pseudomonas sp. Bi70]
MAWPTRKSLSRSVHCPAAPPAVLAAIRLTLICPGAITPNVSCDSCPVAPIGGIPVAPTTRAAMQAKATARGTLSSAISGSISNSSTCSVSTSSEARTSMSSGSFAGLCRGVSPVARAIRRLATKRTASAVRVAQTSRVTPGHSSHSTKGANCGPLASSASVTRPLLNNQGAKPPQAISAPSSSDRPTRMPMMPPKPISSGDGSRLKVSRSNCALGDQRGRA